MSSGSTQPHSIISPWFDTLAIGGLSVVFFAGLLLFDPEWAAKDVAENFVVLTALFNWPHFMATYSLMYKSPETVKRYPWASIYIPAVLALACIAAVLAATIKGWEGSLSFLTYMGGAYLAWHYTGQTWGMMASFSFLDGAPFKDHERTWVRTGLRVLLAWHFIWFLHSVSWDGQALAESDLYLSFYEWATYGLIPAGALIGGYGIWQWRARIDRSPPARVLVPFFAIVLWYVMMAVNPIAIFWVQIAHSLQYLIFPLRVEINRGAAKESKALRTAVLFGFGVLGLGLAVFVALPEVILIALPAASIAAVKLGIGSFINIHHYFADGVLWKISNPAVRKELFAHIKR